MTRPPCVASVVLALAGCHRHPPAQTAPHASDAPVAIVDGPLLSVRPVALPGASGKVLMDYIAVDPATRAVWIPAGNTARVDVLDTATLAVRAVEGFVTAEVQGPRGPRTVGPSSVAVGEGVVYVGNRGDNQVCPIDPIALRTGPCASLPTAPDGLALVSSAHELWITTPRDRSVTVLHVDGLAQPTPVAVLPLGGRTEGFAVDPVRGRYYTNLEDANRTVAIDLATRRVVAAWPSACGDGGPRGLAIDPPHAQLFVACDDRVNTLDLAHDGALLGSVATGGGVDAIDFLPARGLLYVASGATARLRVVRVDPSGALRIVASAITAEGARNAVADDRGVAYVTDTAGGRILVVEAPPADAAP